MAFTVEDGSKVAGANSYVDLEFACDYFADRGETRWDSMSSQDQRVALIKATDYIDKRFGMQFSGYRNTRDQSLQWPRFDACYQDDWWISSNEIPKELKQATCEYALQAALTGSLITQSSSSGTASPKVAETIKVGPITVSEKFADSSGDARQSGVDVISSSNIPEYPAADLLLQQLLGPSSDSDLVRG